MIMVRPGVAGEGERSSGEIAVTNARHRHDLVDHDKLLRAVPGAALEVLGGKGEHVFEVDSSGVPPAGNAIGGCQCQPLLSRLVMGSDSASAADGARPAGEPRRPRDIIPARLEEGRVVVNAAEALGHRVGRDVQIVASGSPTSPRATAKGRRTAPRPAGRVTKPTARLAPPPCVIPKPSAEVARMHREARLRVEMIPQPLWELSAAKTAPPALWARARQDVLGAAGGGCRVCGTRAVLECHEEWAYDDSRCVQRLVDLVALCDECHRVKTPGRLGWLAEKNPHRYADLPAEGRAHLAAVNGWSLKQTGEYLAWCFAVNHARCGHAWTQTMGRFFRTGDPFKIAATERVCQNCFQVVPAAADLDCPH